MSELTLTLIKLGFLGLLWLFVLSAVSVIRSDLFGERVDPAQLTGQGRPVAQLRSRASHPSRPRAPPRRSYAAGDHRGQQHRGDRATGHPARHPLLGRGADATIRLDDDYVSTRHARFVPNGDDWYVEDLGSTNGTYIGSQRITTPMVVTVGVQVRVGKTIAELKK